MDCFFISAAKGVGRDLELDAFSGASQRSETAQGWVRLWAESCEGFGVLLVEPKPWDSEHLSVSTGSLLLATTANDPRHRKHIASTLLRAFLSRRCNYKYLVTRIPCEDVPLLHALEENDFRVVVPMVTLGRDYLERSRVELPPEVEISAVRPDDIEALSSVSARAFQWGRFSADLRLSHEAAAKVHATWARNCALGTHAARTLVARKGGELLGFIAVKFFFLSNQQIGSIELIATSPSARCSGIGRALVRSGCNWIKESTPHVVVRTELPNIPALRMYEAEGFRVLNGSIYLSLWQAHRD